MLSPSMMVFVSLFGRFTTRWLTLAERLGEESGSGGLYIYLGTFRVEAVLADGDVLLQGIVDARLQVPLGGQAVGWLLGTAGYLRGSAVLGGHSHAACHT